VILGHVMGMPVEETVLQFGAAGATITTIAIAGRLALEWLLSRMRRR